MGSVNLQHEAATADVLEYASVTLEKLRACSTCKYQNWSREDLDGCTSNGTPIIGIFFCSRYHGRVLPGKPPRPPCGQDNWVKDNTGMQWGSYKFPECQAR